NSFGEEQLPNEVTGSPSPDTYIVQSVSILKLVSYAGAAGASFVVPKRVVEEVSARFDNTLYGYFISKRVAFSVVEYYVRNNWGKYGFTRLMMNSKGSFFFKFDLRKGLEDVLKNMPWMIRNKLIIFNK
ncbi:zinc knuckle CX2CX4HX4C containing protein, partial [Tanacetum coccineum]